MISAIFDLPVIPMLLTSFKSIGLWVHEKKRKIDFQGGHLGFPIGTILAIFDLRHPNASCQDSDQLAFQLRRMAVMAAILDFR